MPSANQLKTHAKVSWAFKMVSQFGSLDYTIMGKEDCWSDSCTEDNHWHPSQGGWATNILAVHSVLYPSMLTESWVEGKSVEEKYAQPTERTAALWGLSSKIDSRIWVNSTRNGLRLGSRHQESPHQKCQWIWLQFVVRGVLHGLRRRRTGLLPSGPKSSFRWEQVLYFIWKPRS